MTRTSMISLVLLASASVATPMCRAQVPPVPAAPAAAGAAPAAPAAQPNLWGFLCPTQAQKQSCKDCWCKSPLGQMATGAAGPVGAMSGGLLGGCCYQNGLANDAKLGAENPNGLAAIVKKDEEDAKLRRANVRFLGTVDCNYWPEAIDVLTKALRGDRNECVRFEAALALQRGCCCNPRTVDALKNCVLGMNKVDRFPVEHSDRVRAAAADALSHCATSIEAIPVLPSEQQEERRKAQAPTEAEYYKRLAQMPREELLNGARSALKQAQDPGAPTAVRPQRSGDLASIFKNALGRSTWTPSASSPPTSTISLGNMARQPSFTGRPADGIRRDGNPNVPSELPTNVYQPVMLQQPVPAQPAMQQPLGTRAANPAYDLPQPVPGQQQDPNGNWSFPAQSGRGGNGPANVLPDASGPPSYPATLGTPRLIVGPPE